MEINRLAASAGEPLGIVTRRGVLRGAALGGLTLALPVGRAFGQEAEEPAPDDVGAFLESIELAAAEAYGAAAATGKLTTPAVSQAANAYGGHHREHAAAVARVAGAKATGRANPNLVRTLRDQLSSARDEKAAARILYDLENGLAGAYIRALSTLKDPQASASAASVIPVEAQHAVVLGTAIGLELEEEVIPDFETQERGLSVDTFPLTEKEPES